MKLQVWWTNHRRPTLTMTPIVINLHFPRGCTPQFEKHYLMEIEKVIISRPFLATLWCCNPNHVASSFFIFCQRMLFFLLSYKVRDSSPSGRQTFSSVVFLLQSMSASLRDTKLRSVTLTKGRSVYNTSNIKLSVFTWHLQLNFVSFSMIEFVLL